MNRYDPTLDFNRTGRELLREDFVDYLLLLKYKSYPSAKIPEVREGYELLMKDLALGIVLIDKADQGGIAQENADDTVQYCTSVHKLFLDSFYDDEFLKSEVYAYYKKEDAI